MALPPLMENAQAGGGSGGGGFRCTSTICSTSTITSSTNTSMAHVIFQQPDNITSACILRKT